MLHAANRIGRPHRSRCERKEKKLDIRVGRFPFLGNGKAIALGEDRGLVKVISDKATGQLIGAHMIGAEVTELIQGYVVAMNLETTEEELMHTVFPHPTLSEMMKEAALDAYGRVLNIYSRAFLDFHHPLNPSVNHKRTPKYFALRNSVPTD